MKQGELLARISAQLRVKADATWVQSIVKGVLEDDSEAMNILQTILPEPIISRIQVCCHLPNAVLGSLRPCCSLLSAEAVKPGARQGNTHAVGCSAVGIRSTSLCCYGHYAAPHRASVMMRCSVNAFFCILADAMLSAHISRKRCSLQKTHKALYQVLSKTIFLVEAKQVQLLLMTLQEGQHVIGDAYDHVVVMFSDIVGFSTMSSTMSAVEVFLMLTNLYYAFDRLVDKYGVYKVETIGDGYMIAAGRPTLHSTYTIRVDMVLAWCKVAFCVVISHQVADIAAAVGRHMYTSC